MIEDDDVTSLIEAADVEMVRVIRTLTERLSGAQPGLASRAQAATAARLRERAESPESAHEEATWRLHAISQILVALTVSGREFGARNAR